MVLNKEQISIISELNYYPLKIISMRILQCKFSIKFRIIMNQIQKESPSSNYNKLSIKTTFSSNLDQPLTVALPHIRHSFSKNGKKDFLDYQNGTKIINELPLLVFKASKRVDRYGDMRNKLKKQAMNQDMFEPVNPFFKKYISRSEQRRKYCKNNYFRCNKSAEKDNQFKILTLQSINLGVKKIFRMQSPLMKMLNKPKFNKFDLYQKEIPSQNQLLPNQNSAVSRLSIPDRQKTINEQLQIQKKEIVLSLKAAKAIPKIQFKSLSKRKKAHRQKDDNLTPWAYHNDNDNII